MIILGVFAVWLVWQVAEFWLTAPRWAWLVAVAVMGVGWQLLVDTTYWWQGVGIGGAAAAFALVADLILVATDRVKLDVLRRNR